MKVKAIEKGFYNGLRTPGAEFDIASEKDLGKWMKPIGGAAKEVPKASKAKAGEE